MFSSTVKRLSTSESPSDTTSSPLNGVRILDLTRVVAGPFATMVMSDLGAEVIKVERPGVGDDTRSWGPPFLSGPGGERESAYFLSLNRNKKSVGIDFKSRKGQEIVHQLAASSDVLLENFVPGNLDRLGLGYSDLQAVNPGLIYCSITGFGSSGPLSTRGGYDLIAASMGGLLNVTGDREGPPAKVGVAMTDMLTALYAHGAVLAALLHRKQTGRGQKIDCNLLSTQVSAMTHLASNYLNAGVESSRWGTAHASIVPYQSFQTRDGFMTIGCGNNSQFAELCLCLDLGDLAGEEDFRTNEARVKNRDKLVPMLSNVMASKTNSQWSSKFEGASFPYGPVNKMSEVFQDPQVLHNGLRQSLEHPTVGQVQVVGPAVKYSEAENRVRSPPPTLGQHTDSVLRELLGYSEQEIKRLRCDKVIA